MENNSILLTDSGLDQFTGGGIVSHNLHEALKSCSNLKYIFAGTAFQDDKYMDIPAYPLKPIYYGYPPSADPFFMDYMAYHLLPDEPIELVQTYGCVFGLTVEELKRKHFCKVVCDLAPHNTDISREEHLKWLGKYTYPHLNDDMLWGMYSRHLRLADIVVVHSFFSANYIKEKARLQSAPEVIPHGCNPPEKTPIYPDEVTPGYFGAIGLDKGLVYSVNAWVNAPHNPEVKMMVGGTGTEQFTVEDKFKEYFSNIGFVNDLNDFYKLISIYIQPSVTEGFGITPLEAMSYGRPVIVSEGVGMMELVTDGKDGFVVPIRNAEAIKEKIIYFQDNPGEVKRMGAEAKKTAEKYTWEKIRDRYVELYNRLQ